MMTRKELYRFGGRVLRVGYCDLAELLRGVDKIGSNGGVYGWNWSAYNLGGVVICTGYRNLTGETVNGLRAWNERAREVCEAAHDWREREERLNALRAEFVEWAKTAEAAR